MVERLSVLITAAEAFPAMERLVLSAREQLDISLHVFSPNTALRSDEGKQAGLSDWADLLCDAAGRGVRIRLLVNDFDAVGKPDMHEMAWRRMQVLLDRRRQLGEEAANRMKILLVYPGGKVGALIRTVVWPRVRQVAAQALDEVDRPLPPGLERIIDDEENVRWWPPAQMFTQTYHQKFLIADRERAIIGGLDIDERRFDGPDHQRPADETWHDVSVEVETPAIADMTAHFDRSWFIGLRHGYTYMEKSDLRMLEGLEPSFGQAAKQKPRSGENSKMVFAGTIARQSWNPVCFGPRNEIADLEHAHVALIESARSLLYIETQFLRSKRIRDALVAAAANPELRLILLLPAAPDVVAFEGNRDDVQRYAEWLQMRALNRLQHVYGDRFGAFCLVNSIQHRERHERDALHGRAIVYVHSKLAVADDKRAIVSSANLNGRSLRWDIEAGVVIDWAEKAAEIRRRLWVAHLGESFEMPEAVDDPAEALRQWNTCAARWEANPNEGRQCGAVPYPIHRARRFSKRHLFLPTNLV